MKRRTRLLIDLVVVLGIILISIPIIIYFKVNFLTSTILFFVIPSIYLFIRKPKSIKRIFLASFLFGILFGFIFDFLAEINDAWSWSPIKGLVFPDKILGIVSIDVMIWFFFWVFLIVVFYEHFIERDRSDKISPNFKYAFYPGIIVFVLVLMVFFINPEILKVDYAYLFLGLFALIPFIILVFRKPALLGKFVKVSAFFFFLYLVFEITSLKLGQWNFPGQYIGTVQLFGVIFPFEEFFFWILMSSTIVLAYYELFVDDEK